MPAALLDPTQILGVSRWIKPMKFAISIAIFTGTMTWLLGYLHESRRAVRAISLVIAVTMTGESFLITMQSLRGVRSHFNHDTLFDGLVFSIMGGAILINTMAAAYAAYLFHRRSSIVSGAHLAGVRAGLIIFVFASLEGGLMVARGSHTVGLPDGGPGLPIVNWSTQAGDLRVVHFVGMHALQALPLLGWWLERQRMPGGRRWVLVTAWGWAAVTILLLVQALAGRPVLALASNDRIRVNVFHPQAQGEAENQATLMTTFPTWPAWARYSYAARASSNGNTRSMTGCRWVRVTNVVSASKVFTEPTNTPRTRSPL